jgi:hypothetical protein
MNIDTVQQRAGNTGLILPDLRGGAATGAPPVAVEAAVA